MNKMFDRMGKEDINNLVFVATGDLKTFESLNELKEFLNEKGAQLVSAISSNVDYLITNSPDSNSVKNKKAEELGIVKISEAQFNEIVKR